MSVLADTSSCRRCGESPFILLDKTLIECRGCFIESSTRKFKQSIGKTKSIKSNDPLLIAYSGGQSSTCLLDLVKSRIDTGQSLEPKFRPSIVHVDMQSILCQCDVPILASERALNLSSLLDSLYINYPGWPIYWTSIEMCMGDANDRLNFQNYRPPLNLDASIELLRNDIAISRLHEALRQCGDLTDQLKFLDKQCSQLIRKIALKINSDIVEPENKPRFVLFGNSASQLATDLLVDVILGQGSTIRSTTSISDEHPEIPFLRPLREFSKKEIAFYLRARNIQCQPQTNLETKVDRKASIQTVTEAFLSKLYVDYPSTYNTLLKTGEKLHNSHQRPHI